jgi:hypothetical protein
LTESLGLSSDRICSRTEYSEGKASLNAGGGREEAPGEAFEHESPDLAEGSSPIIPSSPRLLVLVSWVVSRGMVVVNCRSMIGWCRESCVVVVGKKASLEGL